MYEIKCFFNFFLDRLPAVCSSLPADAQAGILTSKRKGNYKRSSKRKGNYKRNSNRKRAIHKTGKVTYKGFKYSRLDMKINTNILEYLS